LGHVTGLSLLRAVGCRGSGRVAPQARTEPPSTVITVPVVKLCVMQNR
jgi:hypothetical protein